MEQDGDGPPEGESDGGGGAERGAVRLRGSALAHEAQICVDEFVEELHGPAPRRGHDGSRNRGRAVDAIRVGDQHRLEGVAHAKHTLRARMGEALQKLPPWEVSQKLILHLGLGDAAERRPGAGGGARVRRVTSFAKECGFSTHMRRGSGTVPHFMPNPVLAARLYALGVVRENKAARRPIPQMGAPSTPRPARPLDGMARHAHLAATGTAVFVGRRASGRSSSALFAAPPDQTVPLGGTGASSPRCEPCGGAGCGKQEGRGREQGMGGSGA